MAGGRSPSGVSRSPARRSCFTFRWLECTAPVRLDTSPSRALASHSTTGMWRPNSGHRVASAGRCIEMTAEAAPGHPGLDSRLRGNDVRFFGRTSIPRAVGNDERKVIGCFFAKGSGTRPRSVIPAQAGIHPSASCPAKLFPALATCPPGQTTFPSDRHAAHR